MPIKKETEAQTWYKLDNAAKIYPAVRNAKWSANFRVSVELNETIDPQLLQQALDVTVRRFPNFPLKLHPGIFWYYLDQNTHRSLVGRDVANPCMRFGSPKDHGHLFRVRYYNCRIAVEIFHVVCDGSAALWFLNTLAAEYLKRKEHIEIPCTDGIKDCSEPPDPEEMEDAFKKYARFRAAKSRNESRAYHFEGTPEPHNVIHIITGHMPLDVTLAKAKEYGVSLTEFLAGSMIFAFAQAQKDGGGRVELPIRISVPVNLRRFYPSKTLRNFSLFLNPGIEPRYGEFSFEEILSDVHHFMKMNLKEKYLNAIMGTNIASELNPFMRAVPLFLKNIALLFAFNRWGDNLITSTLSNLGQVKLPAEMEKYVKMYGFTLGRSKANIPSATAVSFQNTLSLTWTSSLKERDVERTFFTQLVKLGIPVKIESNLK